MKLLKEYIRQAIIESVQEGALAAYVAPYHYGGDTQVVVIYDAASVRELASTMNKMLTSEMAETLFTENCIKGFLQVGPPPNRIYFGGRDVSTGQCYDAWMVYKSAGPGLGRLVYGAGYALSPSGLLMPDRESVSHLARPGWKRQSTSRAKKPLDDITLPPAQRRTPDDPTDDCILQDEDFLNYAYAADGSEEGKLNKLRREHERTVASWIMDTATDDFLLALQHAGERFFWQKMGAE